MPELPEVETYRRFINELAVGQTIAAVQVNDAHVLATPEDQLRVGLVGRTITGTSRLGKNCFLELDNGQVLVLHFGMTGDIGAYRDEPDAPRFTRVALHLEGSGLRGSMKARRRPESARCRATRVKRGASGSSR